MPNFQQIVNECDDRKLFDDDNIIPTRLKQHKVQSIAWVVPADDALPVYDETWQ